MPRDSREPGLLDRYHLAVPLLYAGFLYCGVMTVLLGVILPKIAALHHLKDSQSGVLLMIQFATCSSGGLFVRRRFSRTLIRGYALMAAAPLALLLPGNLAVLTIGLLGLGLGMAMTSASMLTGSIFPESRGSALAVLNFCWSIGATVCPLIVARLPGNFSLVRLAIPVALAGAAFACISALRPYSGLTGDTAPGTDERRSSFAFVMLFAAIAFLYVGAESTIGGWMSTYASRAVSWNFARSSLTAAWFWAALLFGRGVTPIVLLWMSEGRLHLLSIAGTSLGLLMLVNAHTPLMLLAGAGCAGLTLAPIFPLTISLFMDRAGRTRDAGWVFGMAGFGGAVFPWLTGVVSSGIHSLRAGLLVTMVAVTGMFLLTLRAWAAPPANLKTIAA
jgi:FHS family glucose/mannose:H+ symporter-like MFS transporter